MRWLSKALGNSVSRQLYSRSLRLECLENRTLLSVVSNSDFESGLGDWAQGAGDNIDWTQHTGPTSSSSTGPSGAHGGSKYLYTEASGSGYPYKSAYLDATFDLSAISNPELTFYYHMYGSSMGTLNVDVDDGVSWSRAGQQHSDDSTPWTQATVDLSAYSGDSNVKIPLRGVTGSGYASDMAIDDVRLTGDVVGTVDHFDWATISSPQTVGQPFSVAITAKDSGGATLTSFTDAVDLSGWAGSAVTSHTFLDSPSHTGSGTGNYTLGNAFTPNTDILVTDVRHYYGTEVSVWTDAGVLLRNVPVTSVPGTWVQTALASPLQLDAGTTYRIGAYTAGGTYYYRGMESTFPHGTIDEGHYVSGDRFPSGTSSYQWLVGLRYDVGSAASVSIAPTATGSFVAGQWTGSVTVNEEVTDMYLRGRGHTGDSNTFNVVADTTPPTVTNRDPAPGSTINSSSVDIDITFSEQIQGVDSSDLELSGTAAGSASVGAATNVSGNTWRFPVSGLIMGTLNVSLAPDANDIEDLAGNDLANLTWSHSIICAPVMTAEPAETEGTENTISWSAVADKYYAEYDNDADFSSPEGNSGWTTATSCTFTGLSTGETYHYRVMGRQVTPATSGSWSQTSQADFASGTLTNASVTAIRGDVVLAESAASTYSQTQTQYGVYTPRVLTYNFSSAPTPTGGGTLVVTAYADLDHNSEYLSLSAEGVVSQNLFVSGGLQQSQCSTTVNLTQSQLASLAANGTATFTVTPSSGVNNFYGGNWLRLSLSYPYGSAGYISPGNITSATIAPAPFDEWGTLTYNGTEPAGTTLTVDVLNSAGSLLASDVASGTDLDTLGITASSIKLRANLSTSDTGVTPALHDWSVGWQETATTYTNSSWSNVESSTQVDTTPPTVTNRDPAPGSTINLSSVDIDITFSEQIQGVDSSDLELSGTAAGSASVGAATNVSGNTWRFPVSGLITGTLNVSLAPDANDIEDLAGNDLANVTWDYLADLTPPTVTDRDPAPGSTVTTWAVNLDVTFSEQVWGIDSADLVLTGSAAGAASVATATHQGGNTWRFPVAGLTDGTLDVSLAADPNDVQDLAGHDLAPLAWSYTVGIPPTVIAREPLPGSVINSSSISIDVTFSEAVQGVDAVDLVLTGAAASTASVGTPSDQGANMWRFPVSGLSTGMLGAGLAPHSHDVEDLAGNDLASVAWNYTVDVTPPTVTGRRPVPTSTIESSSLDIHVTFSEQVQSVDASDLVLSGTAAPGASIGTPVNVTGNTWWFPVTGLATGALDVSLVPGADPIEDLVGNDLANETWHYEIEVPTEQMLFLDPFPDPWLDGSKWTVTWGDPYVGGGGSTDPYPYYPFALKLADRAAVATKPIDLSNASSAELKYYWKGNAYYGENLRVEYYDGSTWHLLRRHDWYPGESGVFNEVTVSLPRAALQSDFRVEFFGFTDSEYRAWYVDNVEVTAVVGGVAAPVVIGQTPGVGSTISTSNVDIDVTLSEEVRRVDATDLVLTGSAALAASVGTPTDRGGNTWRFPISGLSHGTLDVSLAPDVNDIEDLAGTDLANVTWSHPVRIQPVLHAEPASTPGSSNTVSWDAVPGAAEYYVEVDDDPSFGSPDGSSGWITGLSHEFTGLADGQTYHYRVKARGVIPAVTGSWTQTSQDDFATSDLTDVNVTESPGDVGLTLVEAEILDPIYNPSFEGPYLQTPSGWLSRIWGQCREEVTRGFAGMPTDGSCELMYNASGYYAWPGDYSQISQQTILGEGATLEFDAVLAASGSWLNKVRAEVWIGGHRLWTKTSGGIYRDQVIDLSTYTGVQTITLRMEVVVGGNYPYQYVMFDNLRLHGPTSYLPSGNIISAAVSPAPLDHWDTLTFNESTPSGTTLTVDLLPATGSTPIPGYEGVSSGVDLSGISATSIRLRANLQTTDTSVTPALHDWTTTWVETPDTPFESGWSNVEYSAQDDTAPSVIAIGPAPASTIVPSSVDLDVVFSEPIQGVDASDLLLTGTAAIGASVGTPTHQGGTTWRFPVSGLVDGTLDVILAPDADDVEDLAGNDLNPSPTEWSYGVNRLGAPILDAEPRTSFGTTNTIYWSALPGAEEYYAEYYDDVNFSSPDGSSGWITDTDYSFTGLASGETYYYRVKARQVVPGATASWAQTTQAEFATGVLTNTSATPSPGDVVLADTGIGAEITGRIVNPSFENLMNGWTTTQSVPHVPFTAWPNSYFNTDGSVGLRIWSWAGNYLYEGAYCRVSQDVDLTGIEAIQFDAEVNVRNGHAGAQVLIDGSVVWSRASSGAYLDQTIDVSQLTGIHTLALAEYVHTVGTSVYSDWVHFDNLRTYEPLGHFVSGNVTSVPITPAPFEQWETVTFNDTTPLGTTLTVDILSSTGLTPIVGYKNVSSGVDISGIAETTIRLRANLGTTDTSVTPKLHDWTVSWQATPDSCFESDWSNVESSTQDGTAPMVMLSAPALTDDTTPSVTVAATDANGLPDGTAVALDVDLNNDGDFDDPGELGYTASSLTGGTTTFEVSPALEDGPYLLRARVSDIAGNEGLDTKVMIVQTNQPPVANANGPYEEDEGSPITFDASASTDPDGDLLLYRWDFDGDGNWDTGYSHDSSALHTWGDDYSGTARVEVYDGQYTDTDTATVTVNNVAPTVAITSAPATSPEGTAITLGSSVVDPGSADTHAYAWSVTKNEADYGSGSGTSFTFMPNDNGSYLVSLAVTDDDGGVGTDSATIDVTNVDPTANDDPVDVVEDGPALAIAVLANDSDPAGSLDQLTIIGINPSGTVGSVSWTATGVTYDPDGNFESLDAGDTAEDTFAYTIDDGDGGTATANVIVTVNGQNDAPTVANPIADVTANEDDPDTGIDAINVFADVDADDTLSLSVVGTSNPTLLTAAVVGNLLTLDYLPDQSGSATITVRATDMAGDFVENVFTVTVLSAWQQIEQLLVPQIIALVDFGVLNGGQGNSLISKLKGAQDKLEQGNVNAGVNKLGAFINQVNALVNSGRLTSEQGQDLIEAAQAAINSAMPGAADATDAALAALGESDPTDDSLLDLLDDSLLDELVSANSQKGGKGRR